MAVMVSLSEAERLELRSAAISFVSLLSLNRDDDTVKSGSEKAELIRHIAMFESLAEELEGDSSISAVNAKAACTYILEARGEFHSFERGITEYKEIAATVRHRAISVRAAALSKGRA